MSERAPRRMTLAVFLEWQRGQDQRYELVDGVPQATTGARVRDDVARGNAVWSREAVRQCQRNRYQALADVIPLPLLGVSLPLSVPYAGT